MEIHWKVGPLESRISRSFEVIEMDTDRSDSYEYLSVININYDPISEIKVAISVDKCQLFLPICIYRPAEGVTLL